VAFLRVFFSKITIIRKNPVAGWLSLVLVLPVLYVALMVGFNLDKCSYLRFAFLLLVWHFVWGALENHEALLQKITAHPLISFSFSLFIYFLKLLPGTVPGAQIVLLSFNLVFFLWLTLKSILLKTKNISIWKTAIIYILFIPVCIAAVVFFMPEYAPGGTLVPELVLLFEAAYYFRKLNKFVMSAIALPVVLIVTYLLLLSSGIIKTDLSPVFFFSTVSILMVAFYKWIFRNRAPGTLKILKASGFLIITLCLINTGYARFKTPDIDALKKDFIFYSRKSGGYDIVLEPSGRYLYAIYGEDKNMIEKIDTTRREPVLVRRLPGRSPQPQRLVFDRRNNRIALANWGESSMSLAFFDADTLIPEKVYSEKDAPGGPIGITFDSGKKYIYMVSERGSSIVKADADTMSIMVRGAAGLGIAYGICYGPARNGIFVSSWFGPFITELDSEDFSLRRRWRAPFVTYQIECDQYRDRVIAADPLRSRLLGYSIKNKGVRVVKIFHTGFGVRDFQVDWDKRLIVTGSFIEGVLELFDLDSGKRLGSWKVWPSIRGVYYDTGSGRVFVICRLGVLELKTRFRGGLERPRK
jgi:hypothetical protein